MPTTVDTVHTAADLAFEIRSLRLVDPAVHRIPPADAGLYPTGSSYLLLDLRCPGSVRGLLAVPEAAEAELRAELERARRAFADHDAYGRWARLRGQVADAEAGIAAAAEREQAALADERQALLAGTATTKAQAAIARAQGEQETLQRHLVTLRLLEQTARDDAETALRAALDARRAELRAEAESALADAQERLSVALAGVLEDLERARAALVATAPDHRTLRLAGRRPLVDDLVRLE
jgi:hypothetical protein